MKTAKPYGKFGLNVMGGADEDYPTRAIVQITARGKVISEHLMTACEIDDFITAAKADLDKVQHQAKAMLARANRVRA